MVIIGPVAVARMRMAQLARSPAGGHESGCKEKGPYGNAMVSNMAHAIFGMILRKDVRPFI